MSRDHRKGLEIAEARRAIDNLIRVGRVAAVDHSAPRAKVVIGDLTTGWLPFMALSADQDRTWFPPGLGAQVVVLSPSGDGAQGFIITGAINQSDFPAPADAGTVHRTVYADGAVVEYDRAAHRMTATLPAGGEIDLTAPGGVTLNGDLVVTGDVHAGGASGVSLLSHKHEGVTPGGGLTGEPEN